MYVTIAQWSTPEDDDPPPCFRQGDVVRLSWVRPELAVNDGDPTVQLRALEIRSEPVVLISACCDLVDHKQPKRKGVLFSPIRNVPKNIARNAELLAGLKASAAQAVESAIRIPANLFYMSPTDGVPEGVIHLEALAMIEFAHLRSCTKLAELTNFARFELQERIKWHFTRTEERAR